MSRQLVLDYAKLGYRVLPLVHGKKNPLFKEWPDKATSDQEVVSDWLKRWTNCNWGIATGSGVSVLDIDPEALQSGWPGEERRQELKATGCPLARTPRGGFHLFFHADWPCSASKIASGVDTRGRGGFIAVAPSKTANGSYHWIRPLIAIAELPPPPRWLDDLVKTDHRVQSRGYARLGERALRDFEVLSEGERNCGLTSLAGRLRRAGLSQSELEAVLLEANRTRCQPPLPEKEVLTIARSVSRYPVQTLVVMHAKSAVMQRAWRYSLRKLLKRKGGLT